MRAELHVHTVLSPCAAVEMIPPLIVSEALHAGIQIIAITDHNTSANVPAVIKAATGTGLTVIPGMEVHTREDVHILTLFQNLEALQTWQSIIDQALPPKPNQPEYFGEQYIVDESGDFLAMEERLLIQPTSLSIHDVYQKATALGALVIPAHVDRKTYGLIGTLGFIPSDINFLAVELSRRIQSDRVLKTYPQLAGYHFIQSGDVHHLEDFLGWNYFYMHSPTLEEIKLALTGQDGRSYSIRVDDAALSKSH